MDCGFELSFHRIDRCIVAAACCAFRRFIVARRPVVRPPNSVQMRESYSAVLQCSAVLQAGHRLSHLAGHDRPIAQDLDWCGEVMKLAPPSLLVLPNSFCQIDMLTLHRFTINVNVNRLTYLKS